MEFSSPNGLQLSRCRLHFSHVCVVRNSGCKFQWLFVVHCSVASAFAIVMYYFHVSSCNLLGIEVAAALLHVVQCVFFVWVVVPRFGCVFVVVVLVALGVC